ncbi:MAG: L-alanine exporter AlaE [archaeon]
MKISKMILPRVKNVMTKTPVTIDIEASVMKASEVMMLHRVGSLVVTREGGPCGIFSRRDLMTRVLALKRDLDQTKVREVMSSPLITAGPEASLGEAVELMKKHDITRLPVLESDKLVGMLTMTDIQLKYAHGYFSLRLMVKRFAVDTLAYLTFWSGVWTLIQVFILELSWFQYVANAVMGFVLVLLLGGIFGKYLDALRKKFNV